MKTGIVTSYPGQEFWNTYTELWEQSAQRSVFQAPHFIRFLAKKFEHSLAIFQYVTNERLYGVAFFQHEDGTYKLLSEIKSDYNFLTLHRDCTEADQEEFFRQLFEQSKKGSWKIVLNYQPSWADYMPVMERQARSAGLFVAVSRHSVCPVLETESPQGILDWFNSLKNYRYYVNRLKKQQNAVFEVFTDDSDLDRWAGEFCACHVKRWLNTPTPSQYDLPTKQELTREVFHAWAKDGLLTRFSIRIGEERIAFNIALRQGKALVGHAQAYDPDFAKFSPGKAVMYFIGEWMSANGFSKIDFGKGGEAYKFGMTNGELELHKIFISNYTNVPFVLRSKMEKTVRSNSGIIAVYRGKIKPGIQKARIRVLSEMSKLF